MEILQATAGDKGSSRYLCMYFEVQVYAPKSVHLLMAIVPKGVHLFYPSVSKITSEFISINSYYHPQRRSLSLHCTVYHSIHPLEAETRRYSIPDGGLHGTALHRLSEDSSCRVVSNDVCVCNKKRRFLVGAGVKFPVCLPLSTILSNTQQLGSLLRVCDGCRR